MIRVAVQNLKQCCVKHDTCVAALSPVPMGMRSVTANCCAAVHRCRSRHCCAAAYAGLPCSITAAALLSWSLSAGLPLPAYAVQLTVATVLIDVPAVAVPIDATVIIDASVLAVPIDALQPLPRRACLAQQPSCSPASPACSWWVSAVIMGE